MKDTKAFAKVKKARTSLILHHPFFASLALRLKVKEDFNCHTAWTDGKVFAYNPHYINMLSADKLEGLTAHVVMHPACNHHKRRGDRDSKTWNKACDYVINGILLDAGLTLPDGYLYKAELADHNAETVFHIINGGDGDEGGEDEADSENDDEKNKIDEQDPQEDEDDDQESSSSNDDEKVENEEQSKENAGDPGLSGEVRDAEESVGDGDTENNETNWEEAVLQAAITARGMGDLPAGVARMVDGQIYQVMDWRELLSRFVENAAKSDYSWLVPNRRYIHQGLYFPSLKNAEIGNIVVAIDTSGSIADLDLAQFGAEICEIAVSFDTEIQLIHCDTKIAKTEIIEPNSAYEPIKPVGGGGTDFRPVFNYIEDNDLQPSCLIYLTDLDCTSFPKAEPNYPVLWAQTGEGTRKPPFGDVIAITNTK